jgi:thioredoxin reductase (NADPH)
MGDQPLSAMQDSVLDLLVVGAGPTGLACAIEAQKAGFRVALVDKGCICNSIFHYPAHMTFFTTSERLEIGGIPFPSVNAKPTRGEALEYYRQVAAYYRLDVRQYHRVERVTGADGAFTAHTVDRFGRPGAIEARKLAVSTGYYDLPNWMDIPGETLSKVHHYYHDPHPFYGMDVVVIGGKNSAAIAALELWRSGAHVTLVYRGPEVTPNVKYWIKPDIENRIKDGEIKAYFSTEVVEITPDAVVVDTPTGRETLPNDFVFAMTGYHPDFSFLERMGVRFEGRGPIARLQSGDAGKQRAGNLSGWRDRCRRAHQRDLHRERALSRKADRGVTGFQRKGAKRGPGCGCRSQFDRLSL